MSKPKRAPGGKSASGTDTLSVEQLLQLYRWIYTSRRVDDMERKLKTQSRVYFQISGAGHEAVLAALGLVARPGVDWFWGYYRDRALALALGLTPAEMLLDSVGAADGTSGGRSMPSHWSIPKANFVSRSSCTGTQFLEAVGCAQASRYLRNNPDAAKAVAKFHPDEFVYTSTGDGTTSQGEFWEALNAACLETKYGQLGVLFLIEDNGYAISVPKVQQTAGGSASKLLNGFVERGLLEIVEVDGTDPVECYNVFKGLEHRLRVEHKPCLVHAHVVRPYSHSESDDDKLYKTPEMREAEAARDPLKKFPAYLVREGVATEEQLQKLRDEVDAEINAAAEAALTARRPAKDTALLYVTSPDVDVRSDRFLSEPQFEEAEVTLIQGVNKTLHDEMKRDPRIVVFGEDVADVGLEELMQKVPGKGGVFKATIGLQKAYGSLRVYNSQLAEATIVGTSVGMAAHGLKPVAEIQFGDYIWPATMQIVNELAKIRWRSNNTWSAPAVIRVAVGGYLGGSGAPYHSQSIEGTFAHFPGLLIAFPSNALDAVGLLRTALRCEDPVLYLEHKRLYRQPILKSKYPGPEFTIPFGRGRIVREGADMTIVTYGATVLKSQQTAQKLEAEGISLEVIDLRTIVPWDQEIVAASVKKTNRVLVVHEDVKFVGFGAEIAAWITENCFEHLDAPVRRVGALDCPVSYGPEVEDAILPQNDDIEKAVRDLLAY
ncbi:MAG TPA: dehydrogenase E1 component subunit alpha/beta [bacterium]|nr:dehydrogenase E1 component subunit alpha/beta [bacterium]